MGKITPVYTFSMTLALTVINFFCVLFVKFFSKYVQIDFMDM